MFSHLLRGAKSKCGRAFVPRCFRYGIQPGRRFRGSSKLCLEAGGRTGGTINCAVFRDCAKEGALRKSGGEIRTNMKYGFRRAQLSASCFVSKNRSITIAFRSSAVRPERRAALRLLTAEPVSTAKSVPSGNVTLLPYGIRRGSTAQWPTRNRWPVEQTCRRVQRSEPRPPLAQ